MCANSEGSKSGIRRLFILRVYSGGGMLPLRVGFCFRMSTPREYAAPWSRFLLLHIYSGEHNAPWSRLLFLHVYSVGGFSQNRHLLLTVYSEEHINKIQLCLFNRLSSNPTGLWQMPFRAQPSHGSGSSLPKSQTGSPAQERLYP